VSNWKHSPFVSFYHRGNKGECKVRIDGSKIILSYEQYDGLTVWKGDEVAPGHFRLTCDRKGGHATLHRMPGDDVIAGYWTEGQNQGMWRIQLKD
jgi:hypothetical protein